MSSADNGNVSLNISDSGIATISFYHPAQNSLPSALLDELTAKIESAGNDSQTRVILLKVKVNAPFVQVQVLMSCCR